MARLLGRGEVRRLLDTHGIAPRKAAGQHFVVDPNTVRKVVRDAGVGPGDLVCEVGPGVGSLTLALRDAGARVVAVEIDAGLVRVLREVVGGDPAVQVVHTDALAVDYARLLDDERASFVANLPYNIATPLVIRALEAGVFDRLLVMVQREVGRRWAARPGSHDYGGVSVKLAALADVRVVAEVSRSTFHPPPHVDSVTVRLEPRPWESPVSRPRFFALIDAGFAQRRKRLRNALSAEERSPAAVEEALVACGLDVGARAEELDLQAWTALAARLA